MGMDCGASVAYGILVDEIDADLAAQMKEWVPEIDGEKIEGSYDERWEPAMEDRWLASVCDRLKAQGVAIPNESGLHLIYTGSGDDRPARCATPAESWIVGFGLFMRPDQYPKMPDSFHDKARWHNWVWMG